MRIAISNIAWDTAEDEGVANLLCKYNIDAIDVAHSKYFSDPKTIEETDIARVREWWKSQGIEITGMQALLFGTAGLNLFGATEVQNAMLEHFEHICRIGAGLGATRLVFGSPKNRDRTGLSDNQADDISMAFFHRLGGIAKKQGVTICLEPNPSCYGCNFMTGTNDTARIVRKVAHSSIRMQLDTGALTINEESPQEMIENHADIIGHVHASEPNLVLLSEGSTDHGEIAAALLTMIPDHIVTIEMLVAKNEAPLNAIERALKIAIHYYRPDNINKGVHL